MGKFMGKKIKWGNLWGKKLEKNSFFSINGEIST
jgi:hypothetical protein